MLLTAEPSLQPPRVTFFRLQELRLCGLEATQIPLRSFEFMYLPSFSENVRYSADFNNEAQFELLTQFTVYCVSNKVIASSASESELTHLTGVLFSWDD